MKSTQRLIDNLKRGARIPAPEILTVNANGEWRGTYAVIDLVYDYAAWVSPEFKREVYQAHQELQTHGVAISAAAAESLSDFDLFEILLGRKDAKLVELETKLAAAAPKVKFVDEFERLPDTYTLTEAAKLMGMTAVALRNSD